VRNRVAGRRTRSLVKTMMAVVGLMLVVTAHAAGAAQKSGDALLMLDPASRSSVESSMQINVPVGITVAALGMVGLLLGLLRFLRKSAKAKMAAQVEAPAQTPARMS
jgi:hypothetical protein